MDFQQIEVPHEEVQKMEKTFTVVSHHFPFTQFKYENGKYTFTLEPRRDGELFDSFSFTSTKPLEIKYICGGVYYNVVDEFIVMCSPYHAFKIQMTFLEEASVCDSVSIKYKSYLFNYLEDRRYLVYNTVKTKYITYMSGMTYKN